MSDLRKAAQQALEALEHHLPWTALVKVRKDLCAALQDEGKQEPVAWTTYLGNKMNERIRELADEAATFSAVMALPTGESGNKLFVERLVHLIVRECVDVAIDNGCGDFVDIRQKLYEQFGVKE